MVAANDNIKNVIYADFRRNAGIVGNAMTGGQPEQEDSSREVKSVSTKISSLHDTVYKTLAVLQSKTMLDEYIIDDRLRVQAENAKEAGVASLIPPSPFETSSLQGGNDALELADAVGKFNEQVKQVAEGIQNLSDALDQKAQCQDDIDIDARRRRRVTDDVDDSRRRRRSPRRLRGKAGIVGAIADLATGFIGSPISADQDIKEEEAFYKETLEAKKEPPSPALDSKGRVKADWQPVVGKDGYVTYVRKPRQQTRGRTTAKAKIAGLAGRSAGPMMLAGGMGIMQGAGGLLSTALGAVGGAIFGTPAQAATFAPTFTNYNSPFLSADTPTYNTSPITVDPSSNAFDPSQTQSKEQYSGLRIKSQESIAGGNATPATIGFAKIVQENIPEVVRFTAFNDAFHQRESPNSLHTKGMAFDVTINNPSQSALVRQNIEKLAAENGFQVKVLDEYANPSSNATGGHLHVQVSGATTEAMATVKRKDEWAKITSPSMGADKVKEAAATAVAPPQTKGNELTQRSSTPKTKKFVVVPPPPLRQQSGGGQAPISISAGGSKGQTGGSPRDEFTRYFA